MKKIVVLQSNISDCGACCLSSIIKYYNGYIPLEIIKTDTNTTTKGTTAYNLKKAAEKYGFNVFGTKTTVIQNELLPVIAHTNDNNLLHFVVIYKLSEKYYYLMDPAKGYIKVKKEEFLKKWTNIILVLKPLNQLPQYDKNSILKDMLNNISPTDQKLIIKIIFLSIILTIISIILSYQLKTTMYFIENNTYQVVLFTSLIFIFLSLLKTYLSYKKEEYAIYLNKNLNLEVIIPFLKHIFQLPLSVIKTKSQGEIITRFNELNNLKDLISEIIITILLELLMAISSFFILYNINRNLFLILCIISLMYIILGFITDPLINKKITDNIDLETIFTSTFLEKIASLDTIKNLSLENKTNNQLINAYCPYLGNTLNFQNFTNKCNIIKTILGESSLILLNAIGFTLVAQNKLALIDLITFNSLLVYYFDPIKNCVNLLPKLNLIKISIAKINEFYYITEENEGTLEPFHNGKINIKDLTYSYDNYHYLLKNISLTINQSEKILLKGPSGSGKSTLCQIINKTLNNYHGAITIDEVNIKDYSLKTIKKNVRYVSQKERLFTDTIENNITLKNKYSKRQLYEVIKITKVAEIIDQKVLRLNTVLLDSGSNLSGGERQRLILARAIIDKPPILILDESLSEVDESLERQILKDLSTFLSNSTIIYVSHHQTIPNYRTINLDA